MRRYFVSYCYQKNVDKNGPNISWGCCVVNTILSTNDKGWILHTVNTIRDSLGEGHGSTTVVINHFQELHSFDWLFWIVIGLLLGTAYLITIVSLFGG